MTSCSSMCPGEPPLPGRLYTSACRLTLFPMRLTTHFSFFLQEWRLARAHGRTTGHRNVGALGSEASPCLVARRPPTASVRHRKERDGKDHAAPQSHHAGPVSYTH